MRKKSENKEKLVHKEEGNGRIKADAIDRGKLKRKLEMMIHPLRPEQHNLELVDIASGKVSRDGTINVEDAVHIGTQQMEQFLRDLPTGFHSTISKKVQMMKSDKKSVKVGEIEVFSLEAIYARVMCVLSTGSIQLVDVLKHELSPVPTSLFLETGDMRPAKNKAALKNNLQVDVSNRRLESEAVIIDGNAILWTCHWPSKGNVEDLVEVFYQYVRKLLCVQDVYLVFDRYRDFSIKGVTRAARAKNMAFRHNFSLKTNLPDREKALASVSNKVQLIDIICKYVCTQVANNPEENRLFVTGSDETPTMINNGMAAKIVGMRTSHEEADLILVQQCYRAVSEGCNSVKIISDDTDVFVLLAYFYGILNCKAVVLMEATHGGRTVVDIGETVSRHPDLVPSLPAIHALTGCDSVCRMCGIGKKTALNVAEKQKLNQMGETDADFVEVLAEATKFIGMCYGMTKGADMSEKRYLLWLKRSRGKLGSAPKLCGLPPTSEVFELNVLRAHYQTIIWKSALAADPPDLDPCQYGWEKETTERILKPVGIPRDVSVAPKEVLKLMACGCKRDEPCKKGNCSCKSEQIPCSIFCICQENCKNPLREGNSENENEDADEDDDAID